MPTEEETLAALFAGKSIPEQKALLAAAEREEQNARVLEEH